MKLLSLQKCPRTSSPDHKLRTAFLRRHVIDPLRLIAHFSMKRLLPDRLKKTVDPDRVQLHRPLIASAVCVVRVILTLTLSVILLKLHKPYQASGILREGVPVMVKIQLFPIAHFFIRLKGMQKGRNIFQHIFLLCSHLKFHRRIAVIQLKMRLQFYFPVDRLRYQVGRSGPQGILLQKIFQCGRCLHLYRGILQRVSGLPGTARRFFYTENLLRLPAADIGDQHSGAVLTEPLILIKRFAFAFHIRGIRKLFIHHRLHPVKVFSAPPDIRLDIRHRQAVLQIEFIRKIKNCPYLVQLLSPPECRRICRFFYIGYGKHNLPPPRSGRCRVQSLYSCSAHGICPGRMTRAPSPGGIISFYYTTYFTASTGQSVYFFPNS